MLKIKYWWETIELNYLTSTAGRILIELSYFAQIWYYSKDKNNNIANKKWYLKYIIAF